MESADQSRGEHSPAGQVSDEPHFGGHMHIGAELHWRAVSPRPRNLGYIAVGPPWHPGRLTMAWVDAYKGIYVVSVYLYDGDGLSERNMAILQHLAKQLATLAAPWIVGGDFNIEPHALEQGHWWGALGAIFVVPETPEGTFRAQGVHIVYDYFIVHPTLGP